MSPQVRLVDVLGPASGPGEQVHRERPVQLHQVGRVGAQVRDGGAKRALLPVLSERAVPGRHILHLYSPPRSLLPLQHHPTVHLALDPESHRVLAAARLGREDHARHHCAPRILCVYAAHRREYTGHERDGSPHWHLSHRDHESHLAVHSADRFRATVASRDSVRAQRAQEHIPPVHAEHSRVGGHAEHGAPLRALSARHLDRRVSEQEHVDECELGVTGAQVRSARVQRCAKLAHA